MSLLIVRGLESTLGGGSGELKGAEPGSVTSRRDSAHVRRRTLSSQLETVTNAKNSFSPASGGRHVQLLHNIHSLQPIGSSQRRP